MTVEQRNRVPIYIGIGIAAIIIVMMTAVWPIWNLFPQYVTEKVKVVSVDPNGCIAETSDNYMVKLKDTCSAKPGEYIMGTYDVKVKERMKPYIP